MEEEAGIEKHVVRLESWVLPSAGVPRQMHWLGVAVGIASAGVGRYNSANGRTSNAHH
jgi:hypothetical protein